MARLPYNTRVRHSYLDGRASLSLVALLSSAIGACTSGQTGSPVVDNDPPVEGIPSYESPSRFEPGGGGTTEDGTGFDGAGVPIWARGRVPRIALAGNTLYVAPEGGRSGGERHLYQGHDFLVFDTSASPPAEVGTLPIEGRVLQFEVKGAQALIAVSRPQSVAGETLPTTTGDTNAFELLLLDVSDPTAPSVMATHTFAEEFWQFDWQGESISALSVETPSADYCTDYHGNGLLLIEEGPGNTAPLTPRFTLLELEGDALAEKDSLVLPESNGVLAFDNGLVATYEGSYGDTPQTLHWAVASNSSIQAGPSIDSTAPFAGAFLNEDLFFAVSADRNARVLDASSPEAATELTSVTLPFSANRFDALSPDASVFSGGDSNGVFGAVIIDHTDGASPVVTPLDGVQEAHVLSTEDGRTRVLGYNGQDQLTVSLWNADEPTSPALLSTLATELNFWPADYYQPFNINTESQKLTANYSRFVNNTVEERLLVVDYADDTLNAIADSPVETNAYDSVMGDGTVYLIAIDQLDTFSVSDGATTETVLVDLAEPTVASDITEEDTRVRLLWRAPNRFELGTQVMPLSAMEVTTSDGTVEFAVDHLTDDVLLTENYALAMGFRHYGECVDAAAYEGVAEEPFAEAMGLDCERNTRGITVATREGTPTLVATLDLDNEVSALELPADASQRLTWQGYVPLGNDQLLVVLRRSVSCNSEAACEALGIAGSEGMASPGSGPCDPEGGCEPVEPEVIITFSGAESQQLLMVLDLGTEGGPQFQQPVVVDGRYDLYGEGTLDLSRYALVRGSEIGFPRFEYSFEEGVGGNLDPYGEPYLIHYLDRFEVNDGEVAFLDSVNTPGLPVAYAGDSTVISLEPRYEEDGATPAIVHRSELRGGGAYIEQTLDLGLGYRDVRAKDGRLFFIFGPEERCEDNPRSEVFELGLEPELTRYPGLELPFDNWGFVWWERGQVADGLRLAGGPFAGGRLTISLGESGEAPNITSYETAE